MLVFEGDHDRAAALFRSALRRMPSHSQALYGLAHVLPEGSTERFDALAKATSLKPTYLGLLDLGDTFRTVRKDYEGVYKAYRQAREISPQDRGAYTKLADVCRKVGRPEEGSEWRAKWKKYRQSATPTVKKEVLEVELDPEGWTRCPACNRRFSVANSSVFKDGKHQCGQALSIRAPAART